VIIVHVEILHHAKAVFNERHSRDDPVLTRYTFPV
jgi:hypothetical protein